MVLVLIAVAWLLVAVPIALLIGRAVRLADERAPFTDHLVGLPVELTVADVVGRNITQPQH